MSQKEQVYQTSFDLFNLGTQGEVTYSDCPVLEDANSLEPGQGGVPSGDKAEGYAVYVFTKTIPERQTARQYYIVYQPTLWDEYTVQRQWGLVGSEKQQFYTEHFHSARPALALIRRLIERRLRRGYRLSYAA